MELKCLSESTCSLILASLTLIACIIRSEFLISVLKDTTEPKRNVDGFINILLYINVVLYMVLVLLSALLIYAIIKKRHVLMIPWLVWAIVSVFFEAVFIIYVLARGHSKDVLFLTIGTALTLWVIWVIFFFYKSVRHENETRRLDEILGYRYSAARRIEIY